MKRDLSFSTKHRISKKADFERLYKEGKRVNFGCYLLIFLPYSLPRLGFSIPVRFGGAVFRNRRKRRIRNLFIQNLSDLPEYDMIFCLIKKPQNETIELEELKGIFEWLKSKKFQKDS